MDPRELKEDIVAKARELGAALVRTCPTDRWSEHPIQDREYWPCGRCVDVCPVGEDLDRYRGSEKVTAEGREHCARHGS